MRIRVALVALAVLFVNLFESTPPVIAAVPSSGLVVDLRAGKFNSYPETGSTWTDLSGNGNHATLVSSPTWSSTEGGRFALDGTDYFSLQPGMANFTTGLTVSAYANFGSGGTWERIMDFGNGSTNNNFLFARFGDTSDLTFEIYNGANSQGHCRLTSGILANTWATYSVTLDGSNCKIYRDGTLQLTSAYTALPQNISRSNNYIGRSNWADAYFDTGIQAFALYNRALSAAEITDLSNAQKDQVSATLTGSSTFSVSENQTSVGTLTANESASWSLVSATDSAKFLINSSTGVITFAVAPNFEAATDVGANNVYNFTARITDAVGNTTDVAITVTVVDVNESSRVDTFTVTANPTFRTVVTLTVYPSVAGKVLFKSNNVRIPNCIKVTTVVFFPAFKATCTWKPSKRGRNILTATLTPSTAGVATSSASNIVNVLNRSGTR